MKVAQTVRDLASVLLLSLCAAGCGAAPLDEPGEEAPPGWAPAAAPPGYYASANGRRGRDLLQALAAIVQRHRPLSYSGARTALFSRVSDLDDDDVVPCAYTGRRASPVNSTESASRASMNTEHLWPQSLGATGAAQADLHHLLPTDTNTNNRRASYPFGEVASVIWTAPDHDGGDASRLGRAADGRTVFEPQDRIKGDIARALLYFYTRYAGRPPSRFSVSNFRSEEPVLRRWHAQDPPDSAERARNDAVYGAQGNRNPFIDRPEFVEAVGSFQ